MTERPNPRVIVPAHVIERKRAERDEARQRQQAFEGSVLENVVEQREKTK